MLSTKIYNAIKSRIPKISNTELIALRSGNTSIDRQILSGSVSIPFPIKPKNKLPDNMVSELLDSFDNTPMYPNNNDNYWIEYLAKNKFFSFLIDEKYGGIKLSVNEMSDVLTKIASVDPALGVATMVPNSLGPGELISHYGTEKQKNTYLSGLAHGKYIPCFGLTGPNNGSDATGSIDQGEVVHINGKTMIKVNINKRYITLAPVANLMGIAFDLKDPNNILNNNKTGITLALVERGHPGLIQETYHNPLNAGFPNGTIKGEFYIEPTQVIGGPNGIGKGWEMLMDCLSAGRGISLPATANASSKVASFGILNYIKTRKQFNIPLANMEAIQEKVNKMVMDTWIIQSSIDLTNTILDNGDSPAVISAIMKQQTTERGRNVLNHAMDIHAGGAICLGHSNFLEKFYRAAPIGITVEGSNTLTRSLIIFGQGLNKSHPYIHSILDSVLDNNKEDFMKHFKNIVSHSLIMYFKSLYILSSSPNTELNQQIINFANLTNFVALKGGALKREQMLSGTMADIFSNLYLAISVKTYQNQYNASPLLTEYILTKLLNENQSLINKVIDNLGYEKYLLLHLKKKTKSDNFDEERMIFHEIVSNPNIINEIKKNIYIKNNSVLNDLQKYNELKEESTQLFNDDLHDRIINVGEFPIEKK
tara:strand:- start:1748 stop:3700 length:1953 start_codon:yes stop_codon:yes gene_type:complete